MFWGGGGGLMGNRGPQPERPEIKKSGKGWSTQYDLQQPRGGLYIKAGHGGQGHERGEAADQSDKIPQQQ